MSDFIPCRCGEDDPMGIFVSRCHAPHQLRGDLYIVVCRWCGRAAPFVSTYPYDAEHTNSEAIAAWNAMSAPVQASEARGDSSAPCASPAKWIEGEKLMPLTPTPEMVKAAQMRTEIGAEVCGSWAGAYDCIWQLWQVMAEAAPAHTQAGPVSPHQD